MQKFRGITFISLAAVLMQGCLPVAMMSAGVEVGASSAEERGIGGVISDSAIKNTIRYKWMAHSMDLFSSVSATVHGGRALLTGTVDSEKIHQDAVRLTKEVSGVKEVIDEIKVAHTGFGQVAKDAWITTRLISELTVDQEIESINYKIKTENGVVYLTGIAQNSAELKKVTDHARDIGGVKQVISYVKIKPLAKTPPKKQKSLEMQDESPMPLEDDDIVEAS